MAAFTQEQHDTLKAAIAAGVRRVSYAEAGGNAQTVEYASVSDMLQVLALMERDLSPVVDRDPGYRLVRFERAR